MLSIGLVVKNAEIRAKLREAFVWYDEMNNEQDPNCCILEIRLTDGMLIKDHHVTRWRLNLTLFEQIYIMGGINQ